MKFAICRVAIAPLRADKSDCSEMVSQLLFGEIIKVLDKSKNWIYIENYLDNYKGWLDCKLIEFISNYEYEEWKSNQKTITRNTRIKTNLGILHLTKGAFLHKKSNSYSLGNLIIESKFNFKKQALIPFAKSFLNTPYLWGGKTNYGIDCSGFTQVVFRNVGFELPRDASEQEKIGKRINLEMAKGGDLAFFNNSEGKIIHVGLLLSKSKIIHASGRVKIDTIDKKGIFSSELNEYSHTLFSIKRIL